MRLRIVTGALLLALLSALSLPAAAHDEHRDHMPKDWCCYLVPSASNNDPELTRLWEQITKGMKDADRQISYELTKDQFMAFNWDNDDINMAWFKTHCLDQLEGRAFVADLSGRLRLSGAQEFAITHIELHMVHEIMPAWMAYCAEYWKHFVIVHEAPPPPPAAPEVTPYVPQPPPPPAPKQKIKRNRDVK